MFNIEKLHSVYHKTTWILWTVFVLAASNDNPKVSFVKKWKIFDCIIDALTDNGLTEEKDIGKRMRKFVWNEAI